MTTMHALNEPWTDTVRRAGALPDDDWLDFRDTPRTMAKSKARRGTSNGNSAGSAEDRRRRRKWLLETYRADTRVRARFEDVIPCEPDHPDAVDACRCYRCGILLTLETLTVDRIKPGAQGGTYARTNIRPACSDCNSETGGATRRVSKHRCVDCRREDPDDSRRPRKIVEWTGDERCATHLRARGAYAKPKTAR